MKQSTLPTLALGLVLLGCAGRPAPPAAEPVSQPGSPADPASSAPLASAPGAPNGAPNPHASGASAGLSGHKTPAPVAPPPPPGPPPLAPVDCASAKKRGQLALSGAQYDLRTGKDARAFADLESSRERPVEVCGVHDQHALLMALTCSDGSRPLATTTDARRARLGSVGTGGRCSPLIDLYRITCPERRYDVYMDAYFCGAAQSLDTINHPPQAAPGEAAPPAP